MRLIALLMLIFLSNLLIAQCKDCHSFEEAFKDPSIVKTLKINPWQHGIELTSIPDGISTFTELTKLFLPGHPFEEISIEISKLTKLKELSLADTQLEKVPEFMFQLKHLKELILLDNNFSEKYKIEIKKRFETEMPKTKVLL